MRGKRKHCLGSCPPQRDNRVCVGPHCEGTRWKPVGQRDQFGRGQREFPMKQCRVCGYRS